MRCHSISGRSMGSMAFKPMDNREESLRARRTRERAPSAPTRCSQESSRTLPAASRSTRPWSVRASACMPLHKRAPAFWACRAIHWPRRSRLTVAAIGCGSSIWRHCQGLHRRWLGKARSIKCCGIAASRPFAVMPPAQTLRPKEPLRSTTRAFAPALASARAQASPPGPPPMITASARSGRASTVSKIPRHSLKAKNSGTSLSCLLSYADYASLWRRFFRILLSASGNSPRLPGQAAPA